MRPQIRNIERAATRGARVISMLISFSLFFFGFQAEGAATPVPPQLYGKSVVISNNGAQTFFDETTNNFVTVYFEGTVTFYFSSLGRIFARRTYRNQAGFRAYEQVGPEPNAVVQCPTSATGAGKGSGGTGTGTFQDLHFEGRTLITIQREGENGARRRVIEFDQNFGSCTATGVRGSADGKPIRRIGWNGHVEIISSETRSKPSCVVRDGNALAQ